LSCK